MSRDGFLGAGSGRSMARLVVLLVTISFCIAVDFIAFKFGAFNASEATALGTLVTGAFGVWGVGKWMNSGKDAQNEPKGDA